MNDDWQPLEMHRCKECIRPVCQRRLSNMIFNGDVDVSKGLNEYAMHDLFQG